MSILFWLISLACSPTPAKTLAKKNYSVTCPTGWKAEDGSDLDYDFLSCEKTGWDVSGQILVSYWMTLTSALMAQAKDRKHLQLKVSNIYSF